VVFTVVTVIIWALLVWVVARRRGSLDRHAPVGDEPGQQWIVVGGFAIPGAILVVLFIVMVESMKAYPMAHTGKGEPAPMIRVTGYQWWFDAQYLFGRQDLVVTAPTEIHIPIDCAVDIELQTRDVIHSFWVPKLHGKVDLVPGQVNRIRIQADRPGVFEGQCGEYCGPQHANMRLQVVAQSPADFQAWLAAQRASAAQPTQPAAVRGREVFESASCALCHTVRGTDAHGQVGPDLTHVGSRLRIAGGMLANNPANLAAWVTHAQSLKPESQMPDLTQFTGRDLQALVAYLQSLQ
jgi:cytochrome c oxidase subunit 2